MARPPKLTTTIVKNNISAVIFVLGYRVINEKTTIDIKITSMISKCVIAFSSFVQIDNCGMFFLGLPVGESMRLHKTSELVEQFVKVAHFKPVVKVRMSFNCNHGFKYVN